MILVADAGPLIGLAKIGELHRLETSAEKVLIPPAVQREVQARFTEDAQVIENAIETFISVRRPPPPEPVMSDILSTLGAGESEAILLARSVDDCMILLDDYSARVVARKLGCRVTGIVGLLLRWKKDGSLASVLQCLRDLQSHGYWISDAIIQSAVREAGEET